MSVALWWQRSAGRSGPVRGQCCCSREAVRGSAGRYCLSLIFLFYFIFLYPCQLFSSWRTCFVGDLNLLYWLSVAAAPAEPWEGWGNAPCFSPPLCHLSSPRSAPLSSDGSLSWFDGVVLVPRAFPLLRAVATHHCDIFWERALLFHGWETKMLSPRRCLRNGRDIQQRFKANSEIHNNPYRDESVINLGLSIGLNVLVFRFFFPPKKKPIFTGSQK